MGRSFLVLISVMLLVVGCQSKQQIKNDKMVVLKRLETENDYENHKEVTDKDTVLSIKSLLNKEGWEKAKLSMTRPYDYKIYFVPTDGSEANGSEAKSILYGIWFTNGFAELYIEGQNLYKKLSVGDSLTLHDVIH